MSQVDMGIAKKFAEQVSRDEQKASWQEVMKNFVKTTGRNEADSQEKTETPKGGAIPKVVPKMKGRNGLKLRIDVLRVYILSPNSNCCFDIFH